MSLPSTLASPPRLIRRVALLMGVVAVTGCANRPAISGAASLLKVIPAEQARKCKFLRSVQYEDRIYGLGKTPGVMKSIGESGLRNEVSVSAPDANAIVIMHVQDSWFVGSISVPSRCLRVCA